MIAKEPNEKTKQSLQEEAAREAMQASFICFADRKTGGTAKKRIEVDALNLLRKYITEDTDYGPLLPTNQSRSLDKHWQENLGQLHGGLNFLQDHKGQLNTSIFDHYSVKALNPIHASLVGDVVNGEKELDALKAQEKAEQDNINQRRKKLTKKYLKNDL